MPTMQKITLATTALTLLAAAASAQVMIDGNQGMRAEQGMPTTQAELNAKATEDTLLTDSDAVAVKGPSTANVVNVTLPTGTVQIENTPEVPWYQNEKMAGYRNFYFDAATDSYVVYDQPEWENRFKDRWDSSGAATGRYIPAKGEAKAKVVVVTPAVAVPAEPATPAAAEATLEEKVEIAPEAGQTPNDKVEFENQ